MESIFAEGVDMQGDGAYVVLAPSLHRSGKRYVWDGLYGAKDLLDVAEFPDRWRKRKTEGNMNIALLALGPYSTVSAPWR